MDKVILEILAKYLKISNTQARVIVVCVSFILPGVGRGQDWVRCTGVVELDVIFGYFSKM